MKISFIESIAFTRLITDLLDDDEYRELQNHLSNDPEAGDLIRGGGGIRKIRCATRGRGKSGGIRVIYYFVKDDGQILMIYAYPKSKKDNLTDTETAAFRELVKGL